MKSLYTVISLIRGYLPLLVALPVISFSFWEMYTSYFGHRGSLLKKTDVKELIHEYNEISLFSGSRLFYADTTNTWNKKSIRKTYVADASEGGIATHFKNQLLSKGWFYRGTYYGGGPWGDTYCKEKIIENERFFLKGSIHFFENQQPGKSLYEFSISLRNFGRSECG